MNFKFIIPRSNDDEQKFKSFVEPSLGKIGAHALQVFDNDKNNPENIFKKYNAGINSLHQSGVADDDVVVFMHSDTAILDNLFRQKVELLYNEKPDTGLIGIAGATEITERGGWWMNEPLRVDENNNTVGSLVGHLIQSKSNGKMGDGFHLQKGAIGYFDNLVAIDGCFMITWGKIIKQGLRFDEVTYNSNHFYDLDICMQVLEMGYKIACADILIYHDSEGKGVFHPSWQITKELFFNKWKNKGYNLPFNKEQFKTKENIPEIVEIEI